ncbi:hypothetical protein [Metallibacterium sp.]|uniref:hypothetical protein n=2 Tax=Metallibacterium sp. TaxID=2940281 RepID=UPI00261AD8B5|nr:hypothetical protein [Metallibacterium sp.]
MELKSFITETLVQIACGIDDANAALSDSEAIVNPRYVIGHGEVEDGTVYGYLVEGSDRQSYRQAVHAVEFDVAVVAAEGKEAKGGIGVMVGSIGLGAQGKRDASTSSNSRIKFTIPMLFPAKK